jgi:hypothetical protein
MLMAGARDVWVPPRAACGTLAIPGNDHGFHLSAGAGVGSSQKGILRVIGSGARAYAGRHGSRARMPSRPYCLQSIGGGGPDQHHVLPAVIVWWHLWEAPCGIHAVAV